MTNLSFLSISPEFQSKAAYLHLASCRKVYVRTIYQKPDSAGLVEELIQPLDERLETGLDALVVIRAGLENPDMLSDLLPHVTQANESSLIPEQLSHIVNTVEKRYELYGSGEIPETKRQELLARTDRILGKIYLELESFPSKMQIDFTKNTKNGSPYITKRDNERTFAAVTFGSPLEIMRRTREYFNMWMEKIDAPLRHVTIHNESILNNPHELQELERRLTEQTPLSIASPRALLN